MKAPIFLTIITCMICSSIACASDHPVNVLIYEGIGVKTGKSVSEIVKIHGEPKSKETRLVKNKYDGPDDEITKLIYKGYTFDIFKYNHPTQGWSGLTQVTVNSPSIKLKFGLKIGQNLKQVKSILGIAAKDFIDNNGDLILFYEPILDFDDDRFPSEHGQLSLKFKNSILTEFSFSNWPG